MDDCFSKKRKDEPDQLLDRLNNYHPNIKFTVEENPDHFLDTAFSYGNDSFDCKVYKKPGKLPTVTGHQKYQPNGREIALQEPYTEPKTSPQILIAI